uniref:AlNc14C632G12300 protein n=1 Tax=Albugo laibachii Nc14 TaxID=890382 RepID=F0X1J7_9STRA|nr:AlNc14C632G12300 [Albugo laibachii Nc14]|eukprot:CCA27687.1 AlNc14C632G12300 [Albugo laibachii Nc14]
MVSVQGEGAFILLFELKKYVPERMWEYCFFENAFGICDDTRMLFHLTKNATCMKIPMGCTDVYLMSKCPSPQATTDATARHLEAFLLAHKCFPLAERHSKAINSCFYRSYSIQQRGCEMFRSSVIEKSLWDSPLAKPPQHESIEMNHSRFLGFEASYRGL